MRKRYGDLKKRLIRTQGIELNNPNVLYIFTVRADLDDARQMEKMRQLSSMLTLLGVARFALQIAGKNGEDRVEVLRVESTKD